MVHHREEDLIGIPFPNHSSDVLCSLNEQRRDGLLCDVILIVRDQEYRTHRSVLAACSQYFKKLFTVASNDSGDHHHTAAVYEIDFVAPESLTAILEFAYTSTLTVTASNVKEILNAAQMLEIPCIINVCLEIMDSGGGGSGGGGGGTMEEGEEDEEEEEDAEDDEDEEEEEEDEEDDGVSRKDEQDEEEDNVSERSLQSSESRGERTPQGTGKASPAGTSQFQQKFDLHRETSQMQSPDAIAGKQESMESRALKDFSIESLLQEGLYPRMSTLDRRANFSPLLPGFYPSIWAAEFPAFPKQLLDPSQHQHPHAGSSLQTRLPHTFPTSAPHEASRPLDLAVKRQVIKEEMKEEVPLSLLHGNFLKEFAGSGLSSPVNAGSVPSEGHALAPIKDEADFRSYLSFLSSASQLGTLFPPWQMEEERKMKPKASQQCPICNKVIQGAGKLPRHMRTHTGEKPYMCTICEVRFTRQDKLKIHMRKHTGERPYICLHCNSKFVHNYDLKNHLRIHTGVRPYQCEHCYKSFTRSDHLHRHIKRQSCRISRPRRGRKPAAWRTTPTSNFLCPPAATNNRFEENGLSSAYQGVKSHGLGEMLSLANRGLGFKGGDGASRESKESREDRRAEGKHVAEEETPGAGRQRGVFAFALAGEEVLTHPPFYTPTSDPWTMRLERAPPIPEPAK